MFAASRGDSIRPRIGARELAWALKQMCAVGLIARSNGWCVGELRPRDVVLTAEGVRRRNGSGRLRTRLHRRRAARHLARGHDAGCRAVGIPHATALRLLRAWGDSEGAQYLGEAFNEIVAEIDTSYAGDEWSFERAAESVEYAINGRITPREPAWRPQEQAEGRATRM